MEKKQGSRSYAKMDRFKKENKKIELHLIGPLQSNKVKEALEVFDVIQTIDREKIVKKIKDNLNGKRDEFLCPG